MPVARFDRWTADYADDGAGRCVVLLHSSASGRHQWQRLTSELDNRRVVAPNLFGYGDTSPWERGARQRVADQAALVAALLDDIPGPIDVVGHSFGALVGLEVAVRLGPRAGRLVLYEPNPFALLEQSDCAAEFREVVTLHRYVGEHARVGDWQAVASKFVDYFSGDGTWETMGVERRAAAAAAVHPNPHEWDAAMDPELCRAAWLESMPPTLLVSARDSRAPLRAVARVLAARHPEWTTHQLEKGGHLAPMLRSRTFNKLAREFLESD